MINFESKPNEDLMGGFAEFQDANNGGNDLITMNQNDGF